GKSTFCRWAALQIIPGSAASHPVEAPKEFDESTPLALRGRLPLLVPLREMWTAMDCGRGRLTWSCAELEQALVAWVDRSPPADLNGALLSAHLAAGSAFLMLDGLDEVPISEVQDPITVYPRALLLSGLASALPRWEKAGNRILLTSRPYGVDEAGLHYLNLPSAPLEPLPRPLQDLFVKRWFHTLGKRDLAAKLIATLRGREDLAPLAENPMLLTALCVIYGNGGQLPEDHYHLYQRIVDNVLHHRYSGDAREREPIKARLEAIALGMHTGGEGGAMRDAPAAEVSQSEIDRLLQVFAVLNPHYESGRIEPQGQGSDPRGRGAPPPLYPVPERGRGRSPKMAPGRASENPRSRTQGLEKGSPQGRLPAARLQTLWPLSQRGWPWPPLYRS
ncbi:MAG: hypothetical protein KIT00_12210, partial [Rhodospirillales bacterium]|nr:hypothetical protein [Rhodospirillales bacterium]